jgi:hypothetical protein
MNVRVIFVVILCVAFLLSIVSFASLWSYAGSYGSYVPTYEYALIASNILACFGTVFVAYWVYENNEDSNWFHSHIYNISKRLDKIEEMHKKEERQKNQN